MGFGKKLYLGAFGTILITIFIIAGVNFFQSKTSFLSKGKAGIKSVSDVLLKTIEVQYNTQKAKMDSDMGVLKSKRENAGNTMVVDAQTIDLEATDVDSGQKVQLTLPRVIFGLDFITGDYAMVDQAAQFSDSDLAVYQLFDRKLVMVSTSEKNEKDPENRNIGPYFSSGTTVFQDVSTGKPHTLLMGNGKAISLAKFEPFEDTMNKVIAGAFGVSSRILTKDLEGLVSKINVNGKGYSFVCNKEGRILIHPDAAYTGRTVSELEGGEGLLGLESGFGTYKDGGKTYFAYVNHFKPWDLFFVVAVSEGELMAGVNKQILTGSGLSGIAALLIGALVFGIVSRQLMTSMGGMAELAREVAQGNFQHSFSYTARDVIRETVESMNNMVEGLAGMIRDLNAGVDTLTNASGELNHISGEMSTGMETSVSLVNSVASAAEEMSVNMDSVAAAMEQATTNLEAVSGNTNDMRSSIEMVAQNSKQTRDITAKAVEQARLTSERVKKLGQAAEKIDKVTDTINTISSQTNLLALNATIEAARAGEAGKGFAVVANEIKELAGQTAGATEEIAQSIQEIQDQIQGAVTEISEISTIVNDINTYVGESAEAIETQSSTTVTIAENIGQVSAGIQEVNENVAQSSEVSGQVAGEIAEVLQASQSINALSDSVKEKAMVLEEVIERLRGMTERFKL